MGNNNSDSYNKNENRYYLCIDLKSFYASVICVERGLDPMTTNLVVADPERGDRTICLAVSPSMKKMGVRNRCRVFEIPKNIEYIMAPPRMRRYIDYAAEIYGIYIRYISPQDIHVYSIDEAFFDITPYLNTYHKTPKEMAVMLMEKVYEEMGVRATAGIGTNLYLTKIALDITAKHAEDFIGILDEESYKEKLWDHRPLTDFWRIGSATARKLEGIGITTMRQIAAADEELLYQMFGIDAELLIDHAWGVEPVTIADIKAYKPKSNSLTIGQVLMRDYTVAEGRVILREMVEDLCLDMMRKNLRTTSMTIHVGYSRTRSDHERWSEGSRAIKYSRAGGEERAWRETQFARGTVSVPVPTNSADILAPEALRLYGDIMDEKRLIRRFHVYCNDVREDTGEEQLTMFGTQAFADNRSSGDGSEMNNESGMYMSEEKIEESKAIQQAMVDIKARFGKNAIFKSSDLKDEATALERNRQIGGHKSGE